MTDLPCSVLPEDEFFFRREVGSILEQLVMENPAAGVLSRGRIYDDITQTIGNTPLVRLHKVTEGCQPSCREAGEFQSALVGQGPHRRGDDRRG